MKNPNLKEDDYCEIKNRQKVLENLFETNALNNYLNEMDPDNSRISNLTSTKNELINKLINDSNSNDFE